MTKQVPEFPVTVTNHGSVTTAIIQPPFQHRVRKGNHVGKLIGKRYLTCYLSGVQTNMLLDSGAQVTILGKSRLKKHLPDAKIQSLEDLLPDDPLRVTAANGTEVPFERYWWKSKLQYMVK